MDETGEHYAKSNKSGSEGQIQYNLTFNWNIINREKNIKQNITRDEEQCNNGQRGVGMGQWGEGFIGTNIKYTCTKPKVRVEAGERGGLGWSRVEEWGENADNCN